MDYLQYLGQLSRVANYMETFGFKPYYKWITFNTIETKEKTEEATPEVLNLIINGLPSIPYVHEEALAASFDLF